MPTAPTGQVIVQQGHVLQSIWFVRRGYVDLSVVPPSQEANGTEAGADESSVSRLVDTLGPGDFFADRALLPAPAQAAKQVRALGALGWCGAKGQSEPAS